MDPSTANSKRGYTIRPIDPASDSGTVCAILAHYVLNSDASFAYEPATESEMATKLAQLSRTEFPALAAVSSDTGELLGFAYASVFRERVGYRFTCEDSIYVKHSAFGRGIGRALLAALISACEVAGFRAIVAVISGCAEDASVGAASVALHSSAGFREVGRLPAVGWKNGRWLDAVLLQIDLNGGPRGGAADDSALPAPMRIRALAM